MGTRGYRIIRFRGRYYRFYNHFNSYPEVFGSQIVNDIPTDPKEYQKWLAKQRAKASEWASALENFLHVKRLVAKDTKGQNFDDQLSETASEVSEGALLHWTYDVGGDVQELPLPSYMNDTFIEWVYVIDLDREIFSVDHGAHFPLGNIPRHGWINALDRNYNGHWLVLPDLLPDNAVTSLVVRPDLPDVKLIRLYEELDIKIVTPDGINGFHPTQRHETLSCARIFQIFQRTQERVLAHFLLGWKPDDFPFREIAFTIVCLASGRQNVSLVADSRLADDGAHGCANLMSSTDQEEESEFVAHMGVGAHLNDNAAGSAPQSSMYWFEGVLVHLVARLDQPDAIPQSVTRVAQRAREDCPWQPVDAVLISIAHIILVRVFPDSKVQHTKPLPLFIFRDQPSQDPRERFSPSELGSLLQRKERIAAKRIAIEERQARERSDPDATEHEDIDSLESESECYEEGAGSIAFDLLGYLNMPQTYADTTKTEPSFFALALLFDASKRALRPLPATTRRNLPNEIYRLIIRNIEDVETLGACMAVSSELREICSPSSSIIEGLTILPNEATKAYTHAQEVWNDQMTSIHRPEHIKRWMRKKFTEPSLMPGIQVVELATGSQRDITIDHVVRRDPLMQKIRQDAAFGIIWRVVVGQIRHRRSLLLDMHLAFRDVIVPPTELELSEKQDKWVAPFERQLRE